MAKLYIKEYSGVRQVEGGLAQIGEEPGTAQTPVTFTSAAASAAFASGTKMIRIISDTNCHLAFGTGPIATANDMLVIANTVEYFGVKEGQKVSAYDGVT
jgi:hypothetical protein